VRFPGLKLPLLGPACALIFSLVASELSHAQAFFAPVPADLRYASKGRDSLDARQVAEVAAMARHFVSMSLVELAADAGGGEEVFGVDQIFWEPKGDRALFLRLDVSPEQKGLEGRFLVDQDAFLFHGRTPSGLDYALYWLNFSQDEARQSVELIQKLLKALPKNEATARSTQRWRDGLQWLNPISSACARPGEHRRSPPKSQSPKDAQSSNEGVLESHTVGTRMAAISERVINCARGFGDAVYEATIGLAIKVGKGAIKLVKATAWALRHPVQAWRRTRQRFTDFKNLMATITNYHAYDVGLGRTKDKLLGIKQGLADRRAHRQAEQQSKAIKEKSAFQKLSDADKAKFVCRMITKVGIAGASWYFAPANGYALGTELSAFMAGRSVVSRAERGRKLFMETQYNKLRERYEQKRQQQSAEQIAFSRQWARENPAEAAEILSRYESRI
jgi:hypothetical protein